MKYVAIMMFSILAVSASNIYSQQKTFNFHVSDIPVREVFQQIEDGSEFIILFNEAQIDIARKVNVQVNDEPVVSVLEQTFKGTNTTWNIYDRQIVIVSIEEPARQVKEKVPIQQTVKQRTARGSISGNITDEQGMPMIGASIVIDQTTIGTITDVNGNYHLLAVPYGKQTIRISFVGYKEEIREISIALEGISILNVQMSMASIEISEAVTYGQARGQLSAINQQLNAIGIVNVISSEKLQELPDVNVAEAIGRLPGLMVQRDRGEGQKIIIRGLEPKYNTISIGGNMAPSTSTDDRSTDLNMISPEILGGVEVSKASTADKDASGLGGTVNLILKEAPSGFKLKAGILGGYSGQSKSIGNYKANFYTSNRFFNDKLGVMLTGNIETAERNSDRLKVNYAVNGVPNYDAGETYITPWITSEGLEANIENRTRAGGSFLLDWKLSPSSTIKSSNFMGYMNRQIFDRSKEYLLESNYLQISQVQSIANQLLYTNSIEGKHFIRGSIFEWGGSRSKSVNEKPYSNEMTFRKLDGFSNYSQGSSFDIGPPELVPNPENVKDYIDQFYLHNGDVKNYEAIEVESGVFADWQTPFKLGSLVSGSFKVGTKFRLKDRSRINVRYHGRFDGSDEINEFLNVYPDYILTEQGNIGKISILNFLDESYETGEFLNGQYEYAQVNSVLDRELISELYDDYFKDHYDSIPSAAKDNYETRESIFAYYLMAELQLGKYISFIPGIRYEKTDIEYKAYIAEEFPASESTPIDVPFRDTTATNSYHHYLPQIHLKIKPNDWFDIRLAYTNTLSRPDYNQLAPKKIINIQSGTVKLGNTSLKPALSTNYDFILTFYKQKYGLLTLGAFYKDIKDFLWNKRALVLAGTPTDPEILDIPKSALGFTAFYPVNNTNRSTIKGFEIDIQSNMNFLPIKGFVLNMNFTIMDSKTKYPEVLVVRVLNPDYGIIPGAPRVSLINYDTAYVDRLIAQPTYLANVGLGYDNKKIGLSVRLSFNFQDDILTTEQRRPDGADREGTLAFYRWDFQLNQRITKRLTLNANVANILNQPDKSVRLLTGYMTELEYYGYLAQLGIRYEFY